MNRISHVTLTALLLSQLAAAQTEMVQHATARHPSAAAEEQPKYAFEVPAGWKRYDVDWGTALLSPQFSNGETCQISMLTMRPAVGDLASDVLKTFRAGFNTDPLSFYPFPYPKLEWGVSPQGWEYFAIRKSVGGRYGDPGLVGTILMEAKVGNWFATVVATSKDSLVSACLGEITYDTWPVFFSSLHFENVKLDAVPEADLREFLTGTWIAATSSVGLRYSFASNGRYDDNGAYIGPATVLVSFGNGSYSFDGNTLVLTADDGSRAVRLFRLGGTSGDGGKSWKDQICLMDPASTGEVCYQRQ